MPKNKGPRPNNIARLRAQKGWSQQELGERLAPVNDGNALSKSAVGKLEDGSRQLTEKYLRQLTKIFECNPLDILHIDGWDAVYIKGHIKMGELRSALFWDQEDWRLEQFPKTTKFSDAHRFVIRDDDTGALYECVDDPQYLSTLLVGKPYIIQYDKDGGAFAFVRARLQENSDGQLTLRPENASAEIPHTISITDGRVKIVARIVRTTIEE